MLSTNLPNNDDTSHFISYSVIRVVYELIIIDNTKDKKAQLSFLTNPRDASTAFSGLSKNSEASISNL